MAALRRSSSGGALTTHNMSMMIVHSSSPPPRATTMERRRRSLLATAILAGCLLYIALAILDPTGASDGIDYDHYIPGHRFLLDPEGGADSEDEEERPRSPSVAPITSITLKKRSPEDAKKVRQRAVKAATIRARKMEGRQSDLPPEVEKAVLATANAVDVPPERRHNVSDYDVDDALLANRAFHRELLFFVYDSATDDFVVVHNQKDCNWGCKRAYIIAPILAFALRKNYPQRFQGAKSGDWMISLSVGDMPRIRRPCLFEESKYCKSDKWAPLLQFGSVLADPVYMPSAIAMPQSPRPHMPCFDEWQTKGTVCQDLRPRTDFDGQHRQLAAQDASRMGQHFQHGLVFGQELGLLNSPNYWDDLIPQVVWRGTDFMFLHTLFPDMRAPTYEEDIKPNEQRFGKDKVRGALRALWEMGDDLLTPRWRGVLLTSEAEHAARLDGTDALPWLNIKFASCNVDGQKVPANQNEDFRLLQNEYGIRAIGESMSMTDHAQYKYHIDLGGGGGTTWTGTIEKLALPGVLFHHVTPTKDWYHNHLEPWVHYIPVKTDLSDLRQKYEWAEAHPAEAQRISEAGTAFARWMGSPEGFAALYQEHMVAPLGNAIAAYKNPRKKYHGKKVLEILKESKGGEEFGVVARCGGWPAESSECRWTKKEAANRVAATA